MVKIGLLLVLRVISIVLLAFLITQLGLIYSSEIFNIWEVASILGSLRDLFSYLIYILLYSIFQGLFYMFGGLFSLMPSFDPYYFFNFMNIVFANMVGRWFYLPGIDTTSPTMNVAFIGLRAILFLILTRMGMVLLQIIVGFVFFFAFRASITSNPEDSRRVVMLINILIFIPLFIHHILSVYFMITNSAAARIFGGGGSTPNDIIAFYEGVDVYEYALNNPGGISWGDFLFWAFFLQIYAADLLKESFFAPVSDTFGGFITSDIFIVAMLSFLYLEFVFQMAYVDKVTSPALEREDRLSEQIEILAIESERAIANIKAIEEKRREEKLVQLSLQSVETDLEEKKRLSLRSFMSETGASGFSYVSELIEKKRKEKEEKNQMDAMKDTRKVNNYLNKLFKQDPEARSTLTAKTSAPSSARLVTSTVFNMISRIFFITLFTWLVIHPYYVFVNIFQAPDSIANSVELQTVEAVLSTFIPFILLIPLVSTIIKITKYNKLKETLRLEQLKREGLTEEEMQELERKRTQVSEAEVQLERDQQAMAAQQTSQANQQNPPNP